MSHGLLEDNRITSLALIGKNIAGIAVPGKAMADEYAVGEVVGSGTGNYSITGDILPNQCQAGDTVVFQKAVAHRISYAIQKHLIARGETTESLENVCIVMHDNVIAKLMPMPKTKVECSNEATIDKESFLRP